MFRIGARAHKVPVRPLFASAESDNHISPQVTTSRILLGATICT